MRQKCESCGAPLLDTNRSGLCSECYHARAIERKLNTERKGRKCEWCLLRGHTQDSCPLKKSGKRPEFEEHVPIEPVPRYFELNMLFVRLPRGRPSEGM
jgi:hypothetical protein